MNDMNSVTFDSIRRLVFLSIASAIAAVAVTILWLRFPSELPLAIFVVVGLAGAVTFLVSEAMIIVRVVRQLRPPRQQARSASKLSGRAVLGLFTTLVACNGLLLYFLHFRPEVGYIIVLNLAVVVSWVGACAAAAKYLEHRDHREN